MKTTWCAFCRKKKDGRCKGHVEIVGFTKSTERKLTSRRQPNFHLDHDEDTTLFAGESLGQRKKEKLMKSETGTKTEPMATRVALHPFLAGMNRLQLALLTDCAMAAHFEPGQVILREGEIANRFYLVESGKVVLESGEGFGEPAVVERIGAGDLLGWSWMFPPYVWHFTARATEPTEAIFFYGTILREYCERDYSLGYELFKRITPIMLQRLQAARREMLALRRGTDSLEPVVLESPFMDQELDSYNGDNDPKEKDRFSSR